MIRTGIFFVVLAVYLYSISKIRKNANNNEKGLRKYWLHGYQSSSSELRLLEKVLNKTGLEKINMTFDEGQDVHMDWHLAWSYTHHSDLPINFDRLKPYQRLNHFPGNYALVMKNNLAVAVKSKYIPRGFENIEDLSDFAKLHPGARFFVENFENSMISLKDFMEVGGEGSKYFEENLVREFIERPLLIEGHKFDFGVYVVITSINPLRLYYYPKDVYLRVCELPYHPLNASEVNRYVCSEISDADFPQIKEIAKTSKTIKSALESYFIGMGIDITKAWSEVESCIRQVVRETEKYFIDEVSVAREKLNAA